MFDNLRSVQRVIEFLNEHHIPYMLIGGLAVSIWGQPRITLDADFKVSIDTTLDDFRKLVFERYPERPTNFPAHKKSPHVLHIWESPGVAVDLLVSIFDYEKEAIKRAVEMDVNGIPARVCTAEDFIIHKAIANRDKDWFDIPSIIERQRGKLDVKYIRSWLKQFSEALEAPEILNRFDELYENLSQ